MRTVNIMISIYAFLFVISIMGCLTTSENITQEKRAASSTEPQVKKALTYDTIFENTKDLNSKSIALLSMSKYSSFDSMPDYLKLVSDTSDAYVMSFQIINTLGRWWTDRTIEWGNDTVGYWPDENTSLEKCIEYLNSNRNQQNSEKIDATIERLSLGMAQNIVIAATDYFNFVSAVSNIDSQYYDENARTMFSVNSDGSIQVITRKEQSEFSNIYSTIKDDEYKRWLNILIDFSKKYLDILGSNLLLPVQLE